MIATDAKSAARREARARRRALHAAVSHAAADVAAVAYDDPRLGGASVAAVYEARGSELDPARLAQALRRRGLRIVLPVVTHPDAPLAFHDDAGAAIDPDLVFAPLLAFDGAGGRLGQGGGYYDRTLASLRARRTVRFIGVAYAGQEIDAAPMEAHDVRLDGVLTEAGLRLFTGAGDMVWGAA